MIESQETFDGSFSIDCMDAGMIAARIDDEMASNRAAAGDYVRSLFMKHGYFNGRIDNTVKHEEGEITCESVVTCHGLPVDTNIHASAVMSELQAERELSQKLRNKTKDLEGNLRQVAGWAYVEPDCLSFSPGSAIDLILRRYNK